MEKELLKNNNFHFILSRNGARKVWKMVTNISEELPKKISIVIDETLTQDIYLISIGKELDGFIIENTDIECIYNGGHTQNKIYLIHNEAKNVIMRNCRVTVRSQSQVSFTAFYNNGALDTTLETQADQLSIDNCRFDIRVLPNEFPYECQVCGVENVLANSVVLQNNYIFAQLNGNGGGQKVFGVKNSGRYCRIENNNIKANGWHNKGRLTEATHTCGVYNEGQYLLFSGNNCVGEWGGRCVGFQNQNTWCTITGNKILATHTICGRTVILNGAKNILANNILTGTSRNPRFVEVRADYNSITGNYMEVLMPVHSEISGCGIWMEGKEEQPIARCLIADNKIVHTLDFGIYMNYVEQSIIKTNHIFKYIGFEEYIPILYKNSNNNQIEGNIVDGNIEKTDKDLYDRLRRNQDSAICSISFDAP